METITTLSVTENIASPQFKHNPDNEHHEKAISLRKHVKLTLSEGLLIDQRVGTPLRTCLPSGETYTTSDQRKKASAVSSGPSNEIFPRPFLARDFPLTTPQPRGNVAQLPRSLSSFLSHSAPPAQPRVHFHIAQCTFTETALPPAGWDTLQHTAVHRE